MRERTGIVVVKWNMCHGVWPVYEELQCIIQTFASGAPQTPAPNMVNIPARNSPCNRLLHIILGLFHSPQEVILFDRPPSGYPHRVRQVLSCSQGFLNLKSRHTSRQVDGLFLERHFEIVQCAMGAGF